MLGQGRTIGFILIAIAIIVAIGLLLRHALRTFSAFSSSSLRLRFIFRSLASLITHSHLLLEYQLSPWNAIKCRLSLIISRTCLAGELFRRLQRNNRERYLSANSP